MRRPHGRTGFATALIAAALVVLTGCSAQPDSPYPDSIVVIGHSGATGWNSDGSGFDVKGNSWATGDNPDVDSVYLHALARNASVRDHEYNFAISGSNVDSLIDQAVQTTDAAPEAELVLIQSIDNDIRCDGTDDENYEPFRTKLTEVLDELSSGVPDARIFFVSQWASVDTYDSVVVERDPKALAGTGPCDVVDPATLELLPEREAVLQGLVDDYWQIITEVCASYSRCETDEGIMQTLPLTADMLASDNNHLSVDGQRAMAAMVWKALYPLG